MEELALTVKPKPLFTPDGVACADAQARPWPLKHEPPLQPSSAKPMHGWRAERHVANENYNVTKWEGARWHARRRAVAGALYPVLLSGSMSWTRVAEMML